ncbi:MAG: FecR family protein [Methylocystis sp.]
MFVISPWRRIWFCCFLTAAGVDVSVAARADEAIGVASAVRNNVSGSLPTGEVQINVGESVIRNEIVKTAAESWTKLVFSDSTNLSVGPNAIVRLSTFVSAGPSSYGKATVDIAKGAFRFATGHSEKRAYEINTGVATIGVRGTVFDGDSETRSTKLHVASGVVVVRTKKGKLCEVTAGQSVVISDTGCKLIAGFDPGFPSEFTVVEEFAQVQPGGQGFFAAQGPEMWILPSVAGAVGGGVAAGVSNNSSNGGGQDQLYYRLLINSQPASP